MAATAIGADGTDETGERRMTTVDADRRTSTTPIMATDTSAATERVGRLHLPGWCSLASYLLASLALYWRMLPDPGGRTLHDGTSDPAQSMWFLTWLPQAVLHGHDPFQTDFIHYPVGVNLMWNAYGPLLSVIAAPVTLTAGPVVAFNLLLVLGVATGAWTSRLWLGRWVDRPAAAWFGGLVVGFCPFVIAHGSVHLVLAVIALLPVIVMLTEDLLWRRPRPAWRSGVYLGLATAAQALINEELLLLVLVGLVLVVLISMVMRPRMTVHGLWRAAPGLAGSLVVFVLVAGYPLYRQLGGGRRLASVGAEWWSAQPRDWIFPTEQSLLSRGPEAAYWANRHIGSWEAAGYVGILLAIAVVAVAAWLWRSEYAVRIAIVLIPVTMVLALGSRLRLGRDYHGAKILPWRLVQAVPMLHFVLPIRMALLTSLALGFVVAVGVDRARRLGRWPRRAVVAGLVVAVFPLVPAAQKVGTPTSVPDFFRDGTATKEIPWGATTMILPIALPPDRQQPMLWSAEAGARFRDVGGAAKRPGRKGSATPYPEANPLTAWAVSVSNGTRPGASNTDEAAEWMREHGVQYVLVAEAYSWSSAPQQVTALVGRLPYRHEGGVFVWKVTPGS